jgi:hypothetical protein
MNVRYIVRHEQASNVLFQRIVSILQELITFCRGYVKCSTCIRLLSHGDCVYDLLFVHVISGR